MFYHDNSNLLEPYYSIYFQDNLTVQQLKHKIAEYFNVEENNITIVLNRYNDQIDNWVQHNLDNNQNINDEHFNIAFAWDEENQFISFTTPPPPILPFA